jgi:hypothetical protein
MFDFTNNMALSNIAREALNKESHHKQKDHDQLLNEAISNIDYADHAFSDYDSTVFEQKIMLEKNIYDVIIKDATEDQTKSIEESIGSMLKTLNHVYKHINVTPKLYKFSAEDLDLSTENLQDKSSTIVSDYMNRKYYDLSTIQRKVRYEGAVTSYAKDLMVNENLEPDVAITHAYKSMLIESFVSEMCIPSVVNGRIMDLLESDEYKVFCDQEELLNLKESFDHKVHNLSRIFAEFI